MDANERRKEIIRILSTYSDYVTSKQLSELLNVSSRTIKNDMKELIDFHKELDIHSSKKSGYILMNPNEPEVTDFLGKKDLHLDYNLQHNRIDFIILKLLMTSPDKCDKDELLYKLNISDSTLNGDLLIVRNILANDGIRLEARNKKIFIASEERTIRKVIGKYISIDYFVLCKYSNLLIGEKLDNEDIEYFTSSLIDVFRKYHVDIIGIMINNILIHITIAMYRVKNKFTIKAHTEFGEDDSVEYRMAKDIADKIEEHYKISLPEEEIYYLKYCLLGKGVLKANDVENNIMDTIYKTMKLINAYYNLNIIIDNENLFALYNHTISMIQRIENNISIDKSIVEYVQRHFVLAYEMAIIYQKQLEESHSIIIDAIETAYLAIHFGAMIEGLNNQSIRIVVLTDMNTGNILLLKNKLMNYFKDQIIIVAVLSPYEFENLDYYHYNYILSTVETDKVDDYFFIPKFLNDSILRKINNYLKERISIDKLFSPDLFDIDSTSKKESDAIGDIIRRCYENDLISDESGAFGKVMEREKLQVTKFNDYLVLPHPISPISNKNFIYIKICPQGISWMGFENIRLILFIGINKENKNEVDGIFKIISSISSDIILSKELTEVENYYDFIDILKDKNRKV